MRIIEQFIILLAVGFAIGIIGALIPENIMEEIKWYWGIFCIICGMATMIIIRRNYK